MHVGAILAGVALLLLVYWEAFETIVLPRRASRRFRLTRAFYRATWRPWRRLASTFSSGRRREAVLSVYGPVSLLLLLATWAVLLVMAFALLQWGSGRGLQTPDALRGFPADLVLSGATLFTLSVADVSPISGVARLLVVIEAGTGLAFLALVIGYLPLLSQAFSRREVSVALLDARAGSPPTAGELLVRHAHVGAHATLAQLLAQWDQWSAELVETHVSYPVLAYYRSQHDNQSWVAALTTILDVCALTIAGIDGVEEGAVRCARLAFAMARHTAVDLSRVLRLPPRPPHPDRLDAEELARLRRALGAASLTLQSDPESAERLERLRRMYEPYVNALAEFLLMPLPAWATSAPARDNWQSTL